MVALVRESLTYAEVREEAVSVGEISELQSRLDIARAVDRYIRLHVRNIGEADETLFSPYSLISQIRANGRAFGDCDDVAMLAAAMLMTVGFQCRFKAIFPAADGSMQHVFTEYNGLDAAGIAWRPIDPTITGIPVYNPDVCITEDI